MAASVARLREAAREVGVECPIRSCGCSTLGGIGDPGGRVGEGDCGGEVDKVSKDSSYDLARQVASLILAGYQARDLGFNPYVSTDNFPEGTEEDARHRVADVVEAIMVGFDGTPPAFSLADHDDDVDDAKVSSDDPPAT
uniref:Uncharacterized protein n=1 Tax=Leersia perrieri TaxID=77586 RepID=A0A0D9X6D9_9ORYZ